MVRRVEDDLRSGSRFFSAATSAQRRHLAVFHGREPFGDRRSVHARWKLRQRSCAHPGRRNRGMASRPVPVGATSRTHQHRLHTECRNLDAIRPGTSNHLFQYWTPVAGQQTLGTKLCRCFSATTGHHSGTAAFGTMSTHCQIMCWRAASYATTHSSDKSVPETGVTGTSLSALKKQWSIIIRHRKQYWPVTRLAE